LKKQKHVIARFMVFSRELPRLGVLRADKSRLIPYLTPMCID